MQIVNALQLRKDAKVDKIQNNGLTQPLQMIPAEHKNDDWIAANMDWLERRGMEQIEMKAKRLIRNYKHANGELDKSEYIPQDSEDYEYELLSYLDEGLEEEQALELKYYPIIPSIMNVMIGEFSKRADKVSYQNVDDFSFNEMLDEKLSMIEESLMSEAAGKIESRLQEMGIEPESEEYAAEMNPEKIKTLPEIEEFFQKDYRSLYEQWASHQHQVDRSRFSMDEQEVTAFTDMLVSDSEFWHFKMGVDDYSVDVLNPLTTFYHKSPGTKYISEGQDAGFIEIKTVSDVIDAYGHKMTEDEILSLDSVSPMSNAKMLIPGIAKDQVYYDTDMTHEENMEQPGMAMRQYHAITDARRDQDPQNDLFDTALREGKTMWDSSKSEMVRTTTGYWKSQKRVGYYTGILSGSIITDFVDESFQCTHEPVFDNTFQQENNANNLISGEYIEWVWINETWGGVKIAPNMRTTHVGSKSNSFSPIYLDTKPLPFQFNGTNTIYGCRLPIEGATFSDRNSKSMSFVDGLKPFQVGYNLVNNQIADILIDELGTIVAFDQNTLPKSSLNEDWGDGNYDKAFVAMKDFQMFPLDTALSNTQAPINFNNFQKLDMSQTNRLLGRVQLAEHFRVSAFNTVGISQQRAAAVGGQETATGVEQAIAMSYTQTELYFVNHSENLMPRVHEMRTNLAQYYHSTNPSVRLSYVTSKDEKVFFEMNGLELLGRDFNCYATTKVNEKYMMDQLKNLALSNNTSGASIFDLGSLIKADSMAEVEHILKAVEAKMERQLKEEREATLAKQENAEESANARLEAQLAKQDEHHYSKLDNNLDVAKVKSAGYQTGDLDGNGKSDFLDTLKYLEIQKKNEESARVATRELDRKVMKDASDRSLKEKELQIKERASQRDLQIAKTNKNKYD